MGESTENPKLRLRQTLQARRARLDAEVLARTSRAVCEQLASSAAFASASEVGLYAAQPGELDPAGLEALTAGTSGRRFYYPRVEADRLVFREGTSSTLRPGRFRIPEPPSDAPELARNVAALIVVPGLAFDPCGRRLGTGKGYYDRALPALPNAMRVGVCLEAFIMDEIPGDPWDVPMHAIATESRFVVVGPGTGVHAGDSEWS